MFLVNFINILASPLNTVMHTHLILHTQVHTDVTIDHVVPPVAAKGDDGPSSPMGGMHLFLLICPTFHLLLIPYQLHAPMTLVTNLPHTWIP